VSALGLAALLRRAGAGQAVSLLAMLTGFFVVAGVLLFPDTLFVVVPTLATWHAMTDATRVAMQGVVDQAAPVVVTREFLLLTCAGAWAVATSADGLTFRARQPLLALVPALGLFVFPAIVRNSSPAWYTLWFLLGAAGVLLTEGRARLATWGLWVSNPRSRPASGWRLPTTPAANTARWLAVGAGVIALAVPWVLPGYGREPLLDYRTGVDAEGPVSINPFVSLRTRLRASREETMFTVRSVEGTYWRLVTLDQFDGTTWRTSGRADDVLPFTPGVSDLDQDPRAPARELTQKFEIEQLSGRGDGFLPAAVVPVAVLRAGQPILRNTVNRSLTTKRRFRQGFKYEVRSRILLPEAKDLERPQRYKDTLAEGYTEIENLSQRVNDQAHELTDGKPSAYQKALALQDYLRSRNFKYDLTVPELTSGQDQLTRFLFDVKRGYCEQFASAMAAMARAVGLPARVAIGFTPGRQVGDKWEVTTRDAHAWPEIYFNEVGWVRFEPTPRSDQVEVPAYTTPAGRQIASASTTTLVPGATTATTSADRLNPGQRNELEERRNAALGGRRRSPGLLERRAVRVPLAVLLLVLLVPSVKAVRNLVARRRAGHQPRDAVAESYAEVTAWTGDAGIGRRPAETPSAYASRVAAAYGPDAEPLVELTGLYVTAEYAARPATGPDQAHQARRLARAARSRLAARLGWNRRLIAALSPRSLFAPRPIMPRPPASPRDSERRDLAVRR